MIHAYDETLLSKARDSLGRMLDFSAHTLHIEPSTMLALFSASGVASAFERGDIRTIVGMSGIELAYEILDRSGVEYERQSPRHTISLSAEYSYGSDLALRQWKSGISFAELCGSSSHTGAGEGASISPLKKMRMKNGLSQSQLAGASSVPLRTIQQYEQRQKDINKAGFEYIIRMASVLNCEPSSLLERSTD